jgi:hypothetical protein
MNERELVTAPGVVFRTQYVGNVPSDPLPETDPLSWRELSRALNTQTDECIICTLAPQGNGGYPQARLAATGFRLTRLICEIAHGAPPTPKHEAAHSCHQPMCINPRHLRWLTHEENMAERRGRRAPEMTAEDADAIRTARHPIAEGLRRGFTQKRIRAVLSAILKSERPEEE